MFFEKNTFHYDAELHKLLFIDDSLLKVDFVIFYSVHLIFYRKILILLYRYLKSTAIKSVLLCVFMLKIQQT